MVHSLHYYYARLRDLSRVLKISLDQASSELGISPSYLQQLEKGRVPDVHRDNTLPIRVIKYVGELESVLAEGKLTVPDTPDPRKGKKFKAKKRSRKGDYKIIEGYTVSDQLIEKARANEIYWRGISGSYSRSRELEDQVDNGQIPY